MSDRPAGVTLLFHERKAGDRGAPDRLMPLVYAELHALAARQLAGEWRHGRLQTTAVVSEACVRLFGQRAVDWQNRGHCFAIAAQLMRRIRRAANADPLSLIVNSVQANLFYLAREYDRAIETCWRVIDMDANFPEVYEYLKRSQDQKGQYDRSIEAREARRRLLGLDAAMTPAAGPRIGRDLADLLGEPPRLPGPPRAQLPCRRLTGRGDGFLCKSRACASAAGMSDT